MRAALLYVGVLLTWASAFGTTYYINPEGTGDFPTIQAAIDASGEGTGAILGEGGRSLESPVIANV